MNTGPIFTNAELYAMMVDYHKMVSIHADVVTGRTSITRNLETFLSAMLVEIQLRTPKKSGAPELIDRGAATFMMYLATIPKALETTIYIAANTNSKEVIHNVLIRPIIETCLLYINWVITEKQLYSKIGQILTDDAAKGLLDYRLRSALHDIPSDLLNAYDLLMSTSPTPYIVQKMYKFITFDLKETYYAAVNTAQRESERFQALL